MTNAIVDSGAVEEDSRLADAASYSGWAHHPRDSYTRWPWLVLIALAIVVGIVLRASQLHSQMLIDDEWHAVRMLMRADAASIAGHFGLADYCIPLTLYYHWLYGIGVLDEWQMHLPLLVSGIALVALAPWLLRNTISVPTAAIWTALLALSPTQVYFSRMARPYALVAVLGPLAIIAFRNWYRRRGDRRAWATVYVLAAFLAGWMHVLSLAFTLWPFAYYGIASLRKSFDAGTRSAALRSLGAMAALGCVVSLALAVALAAPVVNDWRAMTGKAGADSVTTGSLYRSLLMQFGVVDAWIGVPMLLLLAFGVLRLWRADRDLVGLTLGAVAVGVAVICAARPAWIQHPQVLVRYSAPILAFVLLYVAEGTAGLLGRFRGALGPSVVALASLMGFFLLGPIPTWFYSPNQFMNHEVFQFDYDPAENPYATLLELGPVSPFYLELATRPRGSVTLVVGPERAQSNFMPDPWLQRIHHQNVKLAIVSPICGTGDWDEYPPTATDARFAQMLPLQKVLEGTVPGVDYLILRRRPWTLPPGKDFPWPVPWPDMTACIAAVAQSIGGPSYQDQELVAFDLRRVPATGAHASEDSR